MAQIQVIQLMAKYEVYHVDRCSDGWEFDTTQFTTTVASSLGWVCDRGHYSHHTLSVAMAGNAVGTLLFPLVADKYFGRRFMYYVSLAIHVVTTLPLLWVTSATVHMGFRFLQGLGFETYYLMPYVIYMEVIPPERRALAVMLSFLAWTFGMCFSALVAWLVPNWTHLAIISIIPPLLGFLYWRYLPESPRWLLAKGKVHQCADILLRISETNGMTNLSRVEVEAQLQVMMEHLPVDQPLTAVKDYPKLRVRAVTLVFMSFMSYVVYGVTMLSMSVFSNNFLAHFVLSLFELPSNFTGCIVTHFLGRRFMAYSNYLLLAIFCFVAPFCSHNEWLLMTVVGFAKLFSTSALYVVYLMSSEVLPTPVRTSGTGVVIVFGMIGMAVSPHVLHYGADGAAHYWILLALTVASAACMIPMPETIGLQLPQTFQDAEELGAGRPITSWVHHWNLHRFMPPKEPQTEKLDKDLLLEPS
ncbi:carcinine transporter-like isoform X2 [Scylla paramamosain]|uniref:carcinine transporter-like isoform X2 n=1 Tax=Scylla paramamosain TaxID=85552 RepID=UPI003082BE9E